MSAATQNTQTDQACRPHVDAKGVALQGYSAVSYVDLNRAEIGNDQFSAKIGGATYQFTSADQLAKFKANSGKYLPAYNGWCALGMAIEKTFPVDPHSFKMVNGRLMLFLNNEKVDAQKMWNEGNERENIEKADRHFAEIGGK